MLPLLAFHGPSVAPAWQTWTLVGLYLVGFVVPAFRIARRAHRDGHDWRPWFLLTLLGSILGVMEYRKHVRIQKKRAAEAAQD